MGAVATYDDQGNLAASNSSDAINNPTGIGFGPSWRRYLTAGLYNSEFAISTPDSGAAAIDNVNNPLPYWKVVYVGSGANCITAQWLVDAASGSGGVIRFTMTAASLAGDAMYLEQLVPINSSRSQNWCYQGLFCMTTVVGGVGAPKATMSIDWLLADGATVTGTGITISVPILSAINSAIAQPSAAAVPPAAAAFARVRIGVNATINADTATGDAVDAIVRAFPPQTYFPEYTTPGTFAPALIFSSGGLMRFQPAAGSGSIFSWDGTLMTFPLGETLRDAATGRMATSGDFQAGTTAGLLITKNKAGSFADTDFGGSAVNGGLGVDSTANKLWGRTSGGWKSVAIAGMGVPQEERRCAECLRILRIGNRLQPIVNEIEADNARHGLWGHASCGWRWRIAKALGLVHSHVAWYTAALHRREDRFRLAHPTLELVPDPQREVA